MDLNQALDGVVRSTKTKKFDTIINIEFDFTGVTVNEMLKMSVSTTSFLKQYQNNVLKHWDKEKVKEKAKDVVKVSVRQMLDSIQRHEADPTTALEKVFSKAKGKLSDKELAEILKRKLQELQS